MSIKTTESPSESRKNMSPDYRDNMKFLKETLAVSVNFDVIYREIHAGDKDACFYTVNGFCNDELLQKMLKQLMDLKEEEMPKDAYSMAKHFIPYVAVDLKEEWEAIIVAILSGQFALFIDGFDRCILIDSRAYPARSVEEPEKDKVLRGSRDGFVETVVSNTALIRRRIRSTDLRMEIMNAGESSKTDIVICYMNSRVDKDFLDVIKRRILGIQVDALTMNQESLAECLYKHKWYNPFPKFKYTERPDTAAAQILEGDIIILVDNSPQAMITPSSIFDIIEEPDDYYFPPIIGSYLRLTRLLIAILTYILTPTFLLFMQHPDWIPRGFEFIMIKETSNIPLIWQFVLLELAIDGLKLAAVNTPTMLSTPLSIMAALVLGQFSVDSGWFNAEVMLYMAFVAIANYTQASYELGYALKFMRMINLILTAIFGLGGYIVSILICIVSIVTNKTVAAKSYIYPLIPLNFSQLKKRFLRLRLPETRK